MRKSKERIEIGEQAWAEYQRVRKNTKALRNKAKNAENVVRWRQNAKRKLIEYKGGKCEVCGYSKDIPGAYDFHHTNPKDKDFSISGKTWALERLKNEVDKCMLVCCRCHAEIHHAWYEQVKIKTIEKFEAKTKEKIEKLEEMRAKIKDRSAS